MGAVKHKCLFLSCDISASHAFRDIDAPGGIARVCEEHAGLVELAARSGGFAKTGWLIRIAFPVSA